MATRSTISSTEDESSSGTVGSIEVSSDNDDAEGAAEAVVLDVEMINEVEEKDEAVASNTEGDIHTMLLTSCPQQKYFEMALRRNGFDSPEAMRFLSVAHLAEMKIVPGHRQVLRSGPLLWGGLEFWQCSVASKAAIWTVLVRLYFTMCSPLSISLTCVSFLFFSTHYMALCVCLHACVLMGMYVCNCNA